MGDKDLYLKSPMDEDLFVIHKWKKQMVHIIFGYPLMAKIISSHQKIYQLQYSWKLCFIISPPCCAVLIITLGNALMAGIYTLELVLHPGFI